ncbi:hypothetical protein D5S17_31495 [Pseudonocardiaceae bacterium YIM PH 21723]|nr:hypothetical protein D5S17_31495 [Pseudonocardiaceae bacterium YIM PH 21723]
MEPMSTQPARRLHAALEPLHLVSYFAPGARESGQPLGLKSFWQTYMAFRSAPLGQVAPSTVVAAFASFHPDMVHRSLPAVWSLTTPQDCLDTRNAYAAGALRAAGVQEAGATRAVELLAPVLGALDPTGRALGAANAALPAAEDPFGALWQLATTAREHRGDGHIALQVALGLTGIEAMVLHSIDVGPPAPVMQKSRGLSEEQWADVVTGLAAKGLVNDAGELTKAGNDLIQELEDRTDELAWSSGLNALGEAGVDEVLTTLAPSLEALYAAKAVPVTPEYFAPRTPKGA